MSMSVYIFAQLYPHYTIAFNRDKVHITVRISPLGFTPHGPHLSDISFFFFFSRIKVMQCQRAQWWIFTEERKDKLFPQIHHGSSSHQS